MALALLLAPGLAAGAPEPAAVATWRVAPGAAPAAGEAMAAWLEVTGPPAAAVEVRAWLGGAGVEGAQVWDGAAWARADRYQLAWTLGADGRAGGWVAVRAARLGDGPLELGARVRDAAGRVVAHATWPLAPAAGPRVEALAPGAAAVAAWHAGHLVALAPAHPAAARAPPWDLDGAFALRAPPGAELRALDAAGRDLGPVPPQEDGDLRIRDVLVDPAGREEAEFVRVVNRGARPVALAGWHLEGPGWSAVARGGMLAPGATAAWARDAGAYRALTGRDDALADVAVEGTLRLPNGGGRVALARFGREADVVAWGRAAEGPGWRGEPADAPAAGRLLRRAAEHDTDQAADFAAGPRADAGERAPWAGAAQVEPFTAADAHARLAAVLAGARREVLVEVYAFTHAGLADALAAAAARGVRVGVLVEGAPVGGVPEAQRALLDRLAAAGADVRRIGGSGHDRYATMHAKFAVVDRAVAVLGSENWTPSGFPEDGRGNVGWGVVARGGGLARWLAGVWEEDADLARLDTAPWPGARPLDPAPVPASADPPPDTAVRALLVPDHGGAEVLGLIAAARASLDVEALQLPPTWDEAPNPVLEALRAAAARGVRVRALLDGAPGSENAVTAARLSAWAAEGLPVEARLARDARVHNKAVVVDGEAALVGSINFGEPGMRRNREAALVVRGPAAGAFAAAFEADWGAAAAEEAPARADPSALVAPLAGLAALAAWRGRRAAR